MQLDVFAQQEKSFEPLASRLRPKTFDDFLGQKQVATLIENLKKKPSPVIFWGPPGTGKTTLALLFADHFKVAFYPFNAVTSGVPELKKIIQEMLDLNKTYGKKSLLFIDEIHRFNKSQQDALLPYLENGDFLFMGATTEYPQTSLNRALLSRITLIELKPLSEDDLLSLLYSAEKREEISKYFPSITQFSHGDARFALKQLELLQGLSPELLSNEDAVRNTILKTLSRYDKNDSRHYDVISAFIKSIRGSDPQSALLYLAIMLDGGEDPEFIARRLMILASEDIGLAQSQALQVATNAHYVTKNIGLPEARITLSHATVFLALAPKSNSVYLAINQAMEFVQSHPTIDVPPHLQSKGSGKLDYKYPHDFAHHYVDQNYWPRLPREVFYQAGEMGSEKLIIDQWEKSKKAPL